MSEKLIGRREFLKVVSGLIVPGLVRIPGLEFFAALGAGVTMDVGLNSLISQANAQEFTSEIKYEKPREWTKQDIKKANFSEEVFPKKLEFKPGKKTVIVSAVWQTAMLYDAEGNIIRQATGEEYRFLASSGKPDSPTNLGVYKIQTNEDEDYESSEFSYKDAQGVEHQAPMPFARHLGKGYVKKDGTVDFKAHTGVAMHARKNVRDDTSSSFMSHGCIGIPYAMAEDFHTKMAIGDRVIVIGEKMPVGVKTLKDMVSRLDKENPDYLNYLDKEVRITPEEVKMKKRCRYYCNANGQEIFDFMSSDPKLNPLREKDEKTKKTKVRIPKTGIECEAVMKHFYNEAFSRCQITP